MCIYRTHVSVGLQLLDSLSFAKTLPLGIARVSCTILTAHQLYSIEQLNTQSNFAYTHAMSPLCSLEWLQPICFAESSFGSDSVHACITLL